MLLVKFVFALLDATATIFVISGIQYQTNQVPCVPITPALRWPHCASSSPADLGCPFSFRALIRRKLQLSIPAPRQLSLRIASSCAFVEKVARYVV